MKKFIIIKKKKKMKKKNSIHLYSICYYFKDNNNIDKKYIK